MTVTVRELWGPCAWRKPGEESLLAGGSAHPQILILASFPTAQYRAGRVLLGPVRNSWVWLCLNPKRRTKTSKKTSRPKKDFTNPQGLKQKEAFSATAHVCLLDCSQIQAGFFSHSFSHWVQAVREHSSAETAHPGPGSQL